MRLIVLNILWPLFRRGPIMPVGLQPAGSGVDRETEGEQGPLARGSTATSRKHAHSLYATALFRQPSGGSGHECCEVSHGASGGAEG